MSTVSLLVISLEQRNFFRFGFLEAFVVINYHIKYLTSRCPLKWKEHSNFEEKICEQPGANFFHDIIDLKYFSEFLLNKL